MLLTSFGKSFYAWGFILNVDLTIYIIRKQLLLFFGGFFFHILLCFQICTVKSADFTVETSLTYTISLVNWIV